MPQAIRTLIEVLQPPSAVGWITLGMILGAAATWAGLEWKHGRGGGVEQDRAWDDQ